MDDLARPPSPIPSILKRKRGPSHSNGICGDQTDARPLLKQTRDELVEQEVEEARLQPKGPEEWGLITDDEAYELIARLHEIGPDAFMDEIQLKQLDMRAVGTAMGIDPEYDNVTDEIYLIVLRRVLDYMLRKRQKLPQYNTIDDVANLLKTSSKILVITGAGISTSLGIPDFRSKKTGFYSKLLENGIEDPQDVFSIEAFDHDPSTFYRLAGDILPNMNAFSPTHAFIRLLQDKSRLLTNYTQNIDALEGVAGITADRLLQCHGSFASATCRKQTCRRQVPGEEIFADIRAKRVAYCKKCTIDMTAAEAAKPRMSKKKKSKSYSSDTDDDEDDNIPTPGVMKPDITFFGEKLPDTFFSRFTGAVGDTDDGEGGDRKDADLVIVIGTSMQVGPVALMPDSFAEAGRNNVPVVYVGREACRHIEFDVQLLGDCDAVVWELARRAGWSLEHGMVPEGGYGVEVRECEEDGSWWNVARKGA